MATRKLTEVDITNTVMDSDTLLTVRGNLVQRVKKSDLTRGFISQEDLAVERARIDNLLKLEEGSTTGDAELQDLRVGIDGTEYESAGTAVRTQIENLAAIVEEGGLNLDELVLSVTKDPNKATIYMSDGKIEKTAEIPMQVDSMLLTNSPNPVQNMVVATRFDEIEKELEVLKNEGIGGEVGSTIRLTNLIENPNMVISYGSSVSLNFIFSSTQDDLPTGNGSCKIIVNSIQKSTTTVTQGRNSIEVSPYLSIGHNQVIVTCTDVFGKSKSLAYDITVVQLVIESKFDATVPYTGDITFKYTPYGSIDKEIHFIIDGEEVGKPVKTGLSGKELNRSLEIKGKKYGTYKLEVYSTATVGESYLESPRLTYDIMWLAEGDPKPLIASAYTVETVGQGELISIPYIVYDSTKIACDITLTIYTMENGERVVYGTPQEITVDRSQKYWNTRKYPIGNVYFEIKYGDTVKTHCVVIQESTIKIEAETNDLELLLLSEGRSNDELNPAIWTYGDVTTTFSNMNWGSVGWIADDNGDTCLRLNGDARAEIQFKPFSEDLRTYGKTIELEFTIKDVNNRDATVISCMSGDLGFEVKADTAYIVSEQSRVFCNYKDEERVRLAFVVESKSEYRLLSIYLNGVLSDVIQYPATDNFQQKDPVNISIGSSDCGIDLYVVRSYTTALPSHTIVTNYIADMVDIARKTQIYEENDIYDDYGEISFEKAKAKNSVMVIVGSLPQSKGDKKIGKVVYYDVEDANLNFEEPMTIDVQGTSSQFYVRKNWKIKLDNPHYIDLDQLPAKVICIKVDYAEATGTHNTQNAVLVEKLYSEKVPPQEADPKVRTTIYGKPILLFHQQTTGETPVFYGKANFNYDKGAEEVFGFTDKYTVECWEFCNNTSDACNFLGEIPESWGDDFEARYPDGCKDISRFKVMHDWVVSTKDNVEKFKNEFEQYFNLHYSLIYYVYTFVALMVDQRAKNMFLTYWGSTGKWYPYFYDNDTCFGINNEGQLVFDYYHEDTDQVDGANVYNGQNSTLWKNFRIAYADEIKETYQKLRGDGLITYDILEEQFITKGSDKWSESIFNEDGEFKYVSMVKTDGDASKLPFLRGDGEQHFRYFVENRLNYCDSKWYATDYANDFVSLRIYTPTDADGNPRTDLAVEANADITVVPYSNMYAGVRYKANGQLYQERVEHGEEITFNAPNETFNDTETAIYGASQLSSLGDLAPLYCGTVDVSKATKLTEIKIGDGTTGYANNNLKELSVGTNKLLKKIDIQNCPSFTSALGLSGCQNIEEIYAKGSGITGVELADSGYLKIIQLPTTIANLTMKNQEYIEEFSMDGYSALKTLLVENCPAIDTLSILDNATNLERVRLTGVDWNYPDTSFLYELKDRRLAGIDENGTNTDIMWLDGTCHIGYLTGAELVEIKAMYPYLTITYDTLESQLIYMDKRGQYILVDTDTAPDLYDDGTLDFLVVPSVDENGVLLTETTDVVEELAWTEVYRETIINGGNGTCPVEAGLLETPVKASTPQYIYTFGGWAKVADSTVDANALLNVEGDRYVYPAFNQEIRYYTVNFYINGELKETYQVPYGGTATFAGDTTHPTDPDIFEFVEWKPSPANIQGDTNCYAQYYDVREIQDDWATIAANCNNGTATSKYAIGVYKNVEINYEDGTSETIPMEVIAHNHDELGDGVNKWEIVSTLPYSFELGSAVLFNSEIHALGGAYNDSNYHYKWNGSSWTEVSTLPIGSPGSVVYNNEIHILKGNSHYKWDATNSEWVEVSTPTYTGYSQVMYNSEIHVLGGGSSAKIHYKWDGTSWTQVSTLPVNHYGVAKAVVYNNEIHLLGSPAAGNKYVHYKWDGSAWTQVGIVPIDTSSGKAVVYNNEIHLMVETSHYKYDGSTWSEASTLPYYIKCPVVVYNNEIHALGGGATATLQKSHFKWSTTAWVQQENLPFDYTNLNGNEAWAFDINNKLHLIQDDYHHVWDGYEWTTTALTNSPHTSAYNLAYYNDIIYMFKTHPTTSDTMYKLEGSAWVDTGIAMPHNASNIDFVVYDGCLHIFGGYNTSTHWKFDGTSWTQVNISNGKPFAGCSAIVYQGKIHTMYFAQHYAFDGTDWTKIEDLPFDKGVYGVHKKSAAVYNGELHMTDNKGLHWKWDGTTWTQLSTTALPNNGIKIVFRERLHNIGGGNKYDYIYENPKATLTFFARNALKDSRQMHTSLPYTVPYTDFTLINWINNDLFNALPEELQIIVKEVQKYVHVKNKTFELINKKCFLLSDEELGNTNAYMQLFGEGDTYPVFTDNNSRLRSKVGGDYVAWWTRSRYAGNMAAIQIVTELGEATYGNRNATDYLGVCFGFCI